MFWLYYIWGFFFWLLTIFGNSLEKFYVIYNSSSIIRKREFKYLSYFEKLFLVLFYRDGWFVYTFAHIFRTKEIKEYRRKQYPLIFLFHLYFDKMDYKFEDLRLLVKQYKYFNNSNYFNVKLPKIHKYCFSTTTHGFSKFLIIQKIFFKKYYNSHSSLFYIKYDNLNTVKLNLAFYIFLMNAKNRFVLLDLSKCSDWYTYNFDKRIIKRYKVPAKLPKNQLKVIQYWRDRSNFFKKLKVWKYNMLYKNILKSFKWEEKYIFLWRFNFVNYFKIRIDAKLEKLLKNYYGIKFSESSVTKHINCNKLPKYSFFYIRKNRIFNKGRYSRNRQLYRTGVYWCLWVNIIMVYGLYFIFYRFSFNFGYFWWGILALAYSTILSRVLKYNFHNIFYIIREFINLQRWYGHLIYNFRINLKEFLFSYFKKTDLFNYLEDRFNKDFNYFFNIIFFKNFDYYGKYLYKYWLEKTRNVKMTYIWMGMKEKDTSWFRYKTVIHWIKEIYRMFIT